MPKFKPGQIVHWRYPPGYVSGEVVASFVETTRIHTKGKQITRHGSKENPAYQLRTKKGVNVLKLNLKLLSLKVSKFILRIGKRKALPWNFLFFSPCFRLGVAHMLEGFFNRTGFHYR